MTFREGGCACKAIRYEITGEDEFAFHCQCRKCQRITGGGHSSAFAVGVDQISFNGDMKYYSQGSDNGATTHSGFCAKCGSPVLSKTDRFPDRLYIHVVTLDDPSEFKPGFVVFEEEGQPWDYLDPKLLEKH